MASKLFLYNTRAFVPNLISIILLMAISSSLVLIGPFDLSIIVALIAIETLALFVLGISPFLTAHEIDGNDLILRQGLYFRCAIGVDEIGSIETIDAGPSKRGVFFKAFQSTIYVTTQKRDLISLQLRRKKRFGLVLGKRADRVVFDAKERNKMIQELERLLAPIQADRPDP